MLLSASILLIGFAAFISPLSSHSQFDIIIISFSLTTQKQNLENHQSKILRQPKQNNQKPIE